MKKSIRKTFTLIFILIMAVLMLLLYGINSFFLEDFYFNEKINTIETAYSLLDELTLTAEKSGETLFSAVEAEYGQNVEDSPVVSALRTLNEGSNMDFVMRDAVSGKFVSIGRESGWLSGKLRFYLDNIENFNDGKIPLMPAPEKRPAIIKPSGEKENENNSGIIKTYDNYRIMKIYDKRSETYYLESFGTFSDQRTEFLMSMPVASMIESAEIMNSFLLKVGAVVLVLGAIIIFLTASKITKPINSLAVISEKMSEMDFGAKYDGNDQNEIGLLGQSMNMMSEKLEKSIAELKTANAKLKDDISEKQKIDSLRRDFISNVSHELKTPIALIEGYAEGLQEGLCEDKESRDYYCSVIVDEAGRMDRLVKQLTSLENLEYSKECIEYSRFDIAEMLRSIVKTVSIKSNEKKAEIKIECPDHVFVWADEYMTEEVLTNYISNAIIHVREEGNILLSIEAIGRDYRLNVYNDGELIPDESISLIWDKFYKVDKARSREYGGSGIGLSIVKAIMELHGKSYGVRNKENGVLFYADFEAADISH